MIWDEAMAAVELDEQFFKELRHSEVKFLWLPKRNALTGRWMWLRPAVYAVSGRVVDMAGAELEFTYTRWYKPRDFVIEHLKRG